MIPSRAATTSPTSAIDEECKHIHLSVPCDFVLWSRPRIRPYFGRDSEFVHENLISAKVSVVQKKKVSVA
jgi:hypothetical protein